ncbi:hypothetical protein NQ317_001319 [Molorchus minor]|uniref:Uncharacterized protein n=1 Tax=Molorchus minor TaxID=1323400 RepID=A0ABQ9J8C5_9CUCU|nr:hypothetical protein NQ317_001319 [Molorchus minor]
MAHVYARPHHMLQTEEEVLDIVEDDPSTSTREIARQTEGAEMWSPLSPTQANIFTAAFEKKALDTPPINPKYWFRSVMFTMEKKDGALVFSVVAMSRMLGSSLGHRVRGAVRTFL